MTGDEMIDVVNALYEKSAAGAWDEVEAMLTDDFVVSEAAGLPMAGIYRGRGALRELYSYAFGMLPVARLERIATLAGDEHVIAVVRMEFLTEGTAAAELCELFRFRDGKVCELKPYYFDPQPVIAAAGTTG